jgi:hypothetical protein
MAQDKDWPENPADEPMNKTARLLPCELITINTFIPQNNVDDPRNLIPFVTHTVFKGDNRSSGSPARAIWNENGSHRTQHKFHVVAWQIADPNGLLDNAFSNDPDDGIKNDEQFQSVGETTQYHKASSLDASGNLTTAALADTSLADNHLKIAKDTAPKSSVWIENGWPKWLGDKTIEIKCRSEAINPLVSGAPAISYTFTITIDKSNPTSPTYSLVGDHDGFPAYEIYINGKRVHEHDPLATGEGLGSLGPPAEHPVNKSGPLP